MGNSKSRKSLIWKKKIFSKYLLSTYLGQGTMTVFGYKVSIIQLEQAQGRDRVYWNDIGIAFRIQRQEENWVPYGLCFSGLQNHCRW